MILNASHEITLSGLPSDVLDAYVRYKKGTRAIVSWIVQYGPSRYSGVRSLPIKELARLATMVTGVLKEVPDVIHFHFRETIAARKRLSKYFRGNVDDSQDASDTVNHEHFTERYAGTLLQNLYAYFCSLTKIYTDLCACCDKPYARYASRKLSPGRAGISDHLKNHYENLPVEDTFDDSEPDDLQSCQQCISAALHSCPEPTFDSGLADDEIGIAIELARSCQVCYWIP